MKIGFIGDIVGRPGREIIKRNLKALRVEHKIDFVIANSENASHGFGLTLKNANELFGYGIDLFTGGNHSFDKKEIVEAFKTMPILRPDNYPSEVAGTGLFKSQIGEEKLAVINLMGQFAMPTCDNPFRHARELVPKLLEEGYKNIFIDFHAEATAEKRTIYEMLKTQVSAICGTHTHIGTDDMSIEDGCFYVSDVGLTGCRDGVIGMEAQMPIYRAVTGLNGKFEIENKCKSILQMVVIEIVDGQAIDGYKIKAYDTNPPQISARAYLE